MLEGGLQAVQADEDVVGTSRVRELETTGARAGAPARPQDHGSRDSQGSARRRARVKKPSLQLPSWNDRKDGSP